MTLAELIETVRRVEIKTNRLVNDMMVGAYLSHFKGRGLDFEELREYVPGDDVRDIDWNVTYRLARPFVKRYREERELGVILAVDLSGSTAFGSIRRSKREFAAEVAAALAFSAAHNSDKVGLLLFTSQPELYIPPRKGRRHILRILRELLAFQPGRPTTDIPAALAFLNRVLRRRCIVFLMTDFLHGFAGRDEEAAPDPRLAREIGATNVRHDLVCIHLHDPRESRLPKAGLLTIEDAETGELVEVDTNRQAVREAYEQINARRLASLDSLLTKSGVDTLRLSNESPFAQTLQRFFEKRRGRRRG